MRKFRLLPIVAALSLFFYSCKKGDVVEKFHKSFSSADQNLIDEASTYFLRYVEHKHFPDPGNSNPIKKLKKRARLDMANVRTSPGGEIVRIPIDYEKDINFKIPSDTGYYSLDLMSFLVMQKESSGEFKAEVVTYIPSKPYSQNVINKDFEGDILVDDWGGNTINRYLIKDGKSYVVSKNVGEPQNSRVLGCVRTDYYWCSYIDGIPAGCDFMYSTYSSECYGTPPNEGLLPCDESCGSSDYFEYDYGGEETKTFWWTDAYQGHTIEQNPWGGGCIDCNSRLKGIIFPSNSSRNYFAPSGHATIGHRLLGNAYFSSGFQFTPDVPLNFWNAYIPYGPTKIRCQDAGNVVFPNNTGTTGFGIAMKDYLITDLW